MTPIVFDKQGTQVNHGDKVVVACDSNEYDGLLGTLSIKKFGDSTTFFCQYYRLYVNELWWDSFVISEVCSSHTCSSISKSK